MSAHAEYAFDISASLIVDTDVLIGLSINYLSKIKCCLEWQDNTIPEFGAKKQIKSDGLGFR